VTSSIQVEGTGGFMIYTVYKTVNLVNGKFYLGVHKTDNPNDEYLGSGTYIIRAVHEWAKKFGLSRKKLSMQELRDKKFMKV
jgi:hypothetical protein